ncbi:hypothetical protein [Fictibacillus terranigra]|uniref:Uncharacterized protein n=1 Tax=Fictibacillus terranigra TaxID=3058424 RepID=A0ABT8EC77_9BACL|nr:hypothetical protein [Fictibacillus sp. CENA-BCM004]MDN4075538.1 hypothetical protein [Fictibacillus sp. CENA-BCM004]
MKIRNKLVILIGTTIFALIVADGFSYYSSYKQNKLSGELGDKQDLQFFWTATLMMKERIF